MKNKRLNSSPSTRSRVNKSETMTKRSTMTFFVFLGNSMMTLPMAEMSAKLRVSRSRKKTMPQQRQFRHQPLFFIEGTCW